MEVLKSIENGIMILTINRENALNALNSMVLSKLNDFMAEAAAHKNNLKGIIITGAGSKAFVAGADITEFVGLDAQSGSQLSRKGQAVLDRIEKMEIPVIAAINGFALGGGCELAMACHMRIASTSAKFGQPEVNLGLIPGYAGTQLLVRLIGRAKATELILTGDMISAQEAMNLGLVNHVVEPDEVITKSIELIEKIAKKGPLAVSASLRCIQKYFEFEEGGALYESEQFGERMESAEAKEGISAFLEKRKPQFRD
jgi:enoyl-CoA hydratase